MSFWGQKTFCVIAGASRGIGQAIGQAFSAKVGPGSALLLLSRSKAEEAKSSIVTFPGNNFASITTTSIDLSNPCRSAFLLALQSGFTESKTDPSHYSQFILVHVASSLDSGYVTQIDDLQGVRSYFEFNINSFILLNSVFSNAIKGGNGFIIHITSHGAITPYKSWGLYCAARAAKESLLRSIALETPNIQTLNYAPGLVDSDSYDVALRDTKDPELLQQFQDEKDKGNLITAIQTAQKLTEILGLGVYGNGEHVAYSE